MTSPQDQDSSAAGIPAAFDDIDLEIDDFVTARSRKLGDEREPVVLAGGVERLRAMASTLQRTAFRRARDLAPEPGPEGGAAPSSAREIGEELFQILFPGKVRRLFDRCLQDAEGAGRGLRIRLRIGKPELALLPWELLYDPQARRHLGLAAATPIVRHPEVPRRIQPLAAEGRLSILAVASSPRDLPALDLAAEQRRLEDGLALVPEDVRPSLTWLPDPTAEALLGALQSGRYHVVHVAGHAVFDRDKGEGYLALTGTDGRAARLSAQALGEVLADHPSLRLCVLNACEGAAGAEDDAFGSLATRLVAAGVPAVIAMQAPVPDDDAIVLAGELHGALARGVPVDAAVNLARKRLSVRGQGIDGGAWAIPVLFMRAESGELFRRRRPSPIVIVAAVAAAVLVLGAVAALLLVDRRPLMTTHAGGPSSEPAPQPPAPVEALIVLRVAGVVGPGENRRALSLSSGAAIRERCAGFTYCVEVPGAGVFPLPQNGLLLSPAPPVPRADLAGPAGVPAAVQIGAPIRPEGLGGIVLHKRRGGDFQRCAGEVSSCKQSQGSVHRCEIFESGC